MNTKRDLGVLAERMAAAGIDIKGIVDQALDNCRAENTRKRYVQRQTRYADFCAQFGVAAVPAEVSTVVAFLAMLSESIMPQSIGGYKNAVRALHVDQGLPDPTGVNLVTDVLKGIRRQYGSASEPKTAFRTEDVVKMCAYHDVQGGLLHIRAKAMLLVSYAGMLRASEVVVIRREHLDIVSNGMFITIPVSKTDQEGKGASVPITNGRNLETCPIQAVKDLMEAIDERLGNNSVDGYLFPAMRAYPALSDNIYIYDKPITEVSYRSDIKEAAMEIGLDARLYSGHSSRSGHASTAAANGAKLKNLMTQGRWLSPQVASGYIQTADLLRESTSALLGL
jgi:integrase